MKACDLSSGPSVEMEASTSEVGLHALNLLLPLFSLLEESPIGPLDAQVLLSTAHPPTVATVELRSIMLNLKLPVTPH